MVFGGFPERVLIPFNWEPGRELPSPGGRRQRVALARAYMIIPVLVVLDEPNSNLDEVGEVGLIQAINSLKQNGSTVIIITHRTNILKVTNRLAVVKNGLLEMYGNY